MTDPKLETCPDCWRPLAPSSPALNVKGCRRRFLDYRSRCFEIAYARVRSELATAQAELANASKVIDAAFRWQNACGDNELIAEYQLIDELQRYEAALPKAPGESPPEPPLRQGSE